MSNRNSSLELLRVFCMWGIIAMHTFGPWLYSSSGINWQYGILINSIFNMGVTVFMLITGYFGLRLSIEKIIRLELLVVFYTLLTEILNYYFLDKSFSLNMILDILFPISRGKYWYMSVYIVICLCSEALNLCEKELEKKRYSMLLIVLIFFYYIIPTITLSNKSFTYDWGKGIVNMVIVYLIGRYIRSYLDFYISPIKTFQWTLAIILLCCVGNHIITANSISVGIALLLSRDNSVLILVSSILLFITFKNMCFYSALINYIASFVVDIYLVEGVICNLIFKIWDINKYSSSNLFFAINMVCVSLIMGISFMVSVIRRYSLTKYEKAISRNLADKIQSFL